MKAIDCMTAHVRLCAPNDTIQDAARHGSKALQGISKTAIGGSHHSPH